MAERFDIEKHGNWKMSTKASTFNLGFLGSDVRESCVAGENF